MFDVHPTKSCGPRNAAAIWAFALLVLTCAPAIAAEPAPKAKEPTFALVPRPDREVMLHGFRAPGMGVEVRQGALGFHLTLFPMIVDENAQGQSRTTWFAKFGLTGYFLALNTGSGRMSSLYAGVSLLQGLNNAWDVSRSVNAGSGVFFEGGARWAAYKGLDIRLGVGVLVGFEGQVLVRPTPGVSWSTPF